MYVWIWRFECSHNFFLFQRIWRDFYQNVKKGRTSLKELIFLFLNLLEKSLIPTSINIVFMVISNNSLVPLKWEAPKRENRSIIKYAIFKMAMKMHVWCALLLPAEGFKHYKKSHQLLVSFQTLHLGDNFFAKQLTGMYKCCPHSIMSTGYYSL